MGIDWLFWLCLCVSVSPNLALEITNQNCSVFTYRQLPSGQWIGVFEAPRAGIYAFNWYITFFSDHYERGRYFNGRLEHFPSEKENIANIRNGGRAQVFTIMEPVDNRLLTIRAVHMNNELLCSNIRDDSPSGSGFMTLHWDDSLWLLTAMMASLNETKPRILSDFEECGQEGFVATQHGGSVVTRGQYPWLAALLEGDSAATYRCVASVISKRTVITAAHCIYGKPASRLWVHLGRHDRNQNPEDGADLVSVSNVLTPPQYNGNPLPDLDVGLLVLKNPIWYTRYIKPLCLWSKELPVPAREGDTGTVAGWGYDETGEKTRYPKAVSVRLVPRDQCLKKLKGVQDFITERTICAGNSESHGPCFGDSGSALIVLRNNRWVIRGIVSLSPSKGENCDLSSFVIYCDVSQHLDWIQQNIVM